MATLASDNFDRADNDSLGADWTEQAGDWDISSNTCLLASSTPNNDLTWDTALGASPAADYDIEANLRLTTTGGLSVIGRWADASNYYHLEVNTVSQVLRLRKRVAGDNTTLGSYNGGQTTNVTYLVKMTMVGTALKGYQDGTERISVTDSDLTATGKPAIRADSGGKWIDDFAVYGTAAAPPTGIKPLRTLLGVGN